MGEAHFGRRASVATFALGVLTIAAIVALAILGKYIDAPAVTTRVTAGASFGTMVTFWFAIRGVFKELFIARDEGRASGQGVPRFLVGFLSIFIPSFFLIVYRTMTQGVRAIGWQAAADALSDPVLAAAVNVMLFAFSLVTLWFVSRPAYKATLRRWGGALWARLSTRREVQP